MRRNVFTKTAPKYVGACVVCTLTVMFVSNASSAQVQRLPTEAQPQRPSFKQHQNTLEQGIGAGGTTPILHESVKLTASDATEDARLGIPISISGNTVFVGARRWNCFEAGENCNAVYVLRFDGNSWVETQKLITPNAGGNDGFGESISVNGEIGVVGARLNACDVGARCGSAYVFRLNGDRWIEEQKLIHSDVASHDSFGVSVSISGERIVVGANRDACGNGWAGCGSAYVFTFDGTSWIESQKLIASDAAPHDNFGGAVDIDGNAILVGAPYRDCPTGGERKNCGAAYVFRFNGTTWTEEQQLTAFDAAGLAQFGVSVSLDGSVAVVGARYDTCMDEQGTCGSAYVFRHDGEAWALEQKLTASDANLGAWFGGSVCVSGETVLIGAPQTLCEPRTSDADAQTALLNVTCGAAYLFRFDGSTWIEELKLTASDGERDDGLGSVALDADTAVVGALGNDCVAGENCGAVYVFDLEPDGLVVAIDIKPGNDTNPVNLSARGVLPVAVLTMSVADGDSIDFDATDVDPSSLILAGAAPRAKGRSGRVGSLVDIDGDGDLDLLVHFPIAELVLLIGGPCPPVPDGDPCRPETVKAWLRGKTLDGTPIRGADTITAIQAQRLDAESLRRAERDGQSLRREP